MRTLLGWKFTRNYRCEFRVCLDESNAHGKFQIGSMKSCKITKNRSWNVRKTFKIKVIFCRNSEVSNKKLIHIHMKTSSSNVKIMQTFRKALIFNRTEINFWDCQILICCFSANFSIFSSIRRGTGRTSSSFSEANWIFHKSLWVFQSSIINSWMISSTNFWDRFSDFNLFFVFPSREIIFFTCNGTKHNRASQSGCNKGPVFHFNHQFFFLMYMDALLLEKLIPFGWFQR